MKDLAMKLENISKSVGKTIATTRTFAGKQDSFKGYHDAENWLNELGYKTGSMCSPYPTAAAKNVSYISKWTNLGKDVDRVEAALISDSFRNDNVMAVIFEEDNV